MPWRECKRMDERLRFVARLLEGEEMDFPLPHFTIFRAERPASLFEAFASALS